MNQLWERFQRALRGDDVTPPDLEATLNRLRAQTPAPVFGLLGKTQSGKTSIIRYLTGAEDAAIGSGFRPCTRTARMYQFPTADAPLLSFLDTRGMDEPGYDPTDDLDRFYRSSHLVIVTVKVTDLAQGTVRAALKHIRSATPSRPVVLAITCLHEAMPRQAHPQPYPFTPLAQHPQQPFTAWPDAVRLPSELLRCIDEQRRLFAGLFDACVPIDFTRPEDGFAEPYYGGECLKQTLLQLLPAAYRQTLLQFHEARQTLHEVHLRHALPVILSYTALAGTAGAVPIPLADIVILMGIQARMASQLAQIYGQALTPERWREITAAVGVGLAARTALRQLAKFIPGVGSVVGAAAAAASTYALGRALCVYFETIYAGHIPSAEQLRKVYQEQFRIAAKQWQDRHHASPPQHPKTD
ncbi:MAG: DUF697 domain-containing protein [Gemmataceae bacterium]|nr:GTP-binding DUF697 domain-containing protein [Gemmata sp.]MDW8199352.1 DUF697 domain-containing protein [Gemmataceae bacterium]